MLLKWRGGMGLQAIDEFGGVSKYIFGYQMKSEGDVATIRASGRARCR